MSSKLTHPRRDTLSRLITIKANGVALDITGYTAYFTIKTLDDNSNNDDNAIFTKSWTSHSNPTAGQTVLTATSDQMNIPAGEYKYDIRIESGAGAITTVISSKIIITQDITIEI